MNKEEKKRYSKYNNILIAASKYLDFVGNIGIYPSSGKMYVRTSYHPGKFHHWNSNKGNTIRMGTRQYYILSFIASHGEEGVRFTDIQRYLLGMEDKAPLKSGRGYYSTWLSYKMPMWCKKDKDTGKWVMADENLKEHFKLMNA